MADTISIQQLLAGLRRFPGLVAGPGISSHNGVFGDVAQEILKSNEFNFVHNAIVDDYLDLNGFLSDADAQNALRLEERIRGVLLAITPSAQVRLLVDQCWSAIVSLSPDSCLEDAIRADIEKTPNSRTVTIIDNPSVCPQFRSKPIYKLLGNPRSKTQESGPVTNHSDLMLRQNIWPSMLVTLPDFVKEAPILLIGNEANQRLLERFFASLFSLKPPYPSLFVYLKGDPVGKNRTIQQMIKGRSKLIEVDGTLKEFLIAIGASLSKPEQFELDLADRYSSSQDKIRSELEKLKSMVAIVPAKLPKDYDSKRRHNQLVDALFQPTSLDWNPYLAGFHLPRTQAAQLVDAVVSRMHVDDLTRLHCFVLRGEAGIGKSGAMKEAAVLLSQKGYLVLWLSQLPVDSGSIAVRELAKTLSKISHPQGKGNAPRIVLFCDQPWSSRIISYDLAYELNTSSVPIVLIFSFRNTDLISETGISLSLPIVLDEEIEMSVELDEKERRVMPDVLVQVGAVPDRVAAYKAIQRISTRNAADFLCNLWFLVPNTRTSISLSIEDEYFSLSDVRVKLTSFAQGNNNLSETARHAYECAAVCSSFNLGIPTEVLVRALGISFGDWIDMCTNGKPLWGLIYPEEHQNSGETLYWTRNDVITTILLRVLNGGAGHAGEIKVLKRLISACSIGTDIYRAFIVDLLVRNRKVLGDRYNLEQGIELFEMALSELPYPDRTIEHQYGLWLKDKGADLDKAYEQLKRALLAPSSPAATTAERPEHIYTSLAATVVVQAKNGSRTAESALSEVKEHLRHAQTPSFFNPHTTHVFGTLLLELANMRGTGSQGEIKLQAIAEALPAIERTLQIIGAAGRTSRRFDKDLEMLGQLQQRLIESCGDIEQLKELASRLFSETGNQIGFAVATRKMLFEAARKGKGKDYRAVKEYIDECFNNVSKEKKNVSDRLVAARVDLFVRWQLQRFGGEVDWTTMLRDLELVCSSPLFKDDVIKLFYFAVVLYQLDRQAEANVIFSRLRNSVNFPKLKGDARTYFLGKGGFPRSFQGSLMHSHDQWYVDIPELGADLKLRRVEGSLVDRHDIHCYVGFSFFGPFATIDRPDETDLLLPL